MVKKAYPPQAGCVRRRKIHHRGTEDTKGSRWKERMVTGEHGQAQMSTMRLMRACGAPWTHPFSASSVPERN